MTDAPNDLKFLSTHEWVSLEGDIATMGISDHAQGLLGDLVYVELPEVGSIVSAGDSCAVVESVKAASDVYAPVSGEVVENNAELEDSPEKINDDAFGDGWMYRVKMDDVNEMDALMDALSYGDLIDNE